MDFRNMRLVLFLILNWLRPVKRGWRIISLLKTVIAFVVLFVPISLSIALAQTDDDEVFKADLQKVETLIDNQTEAFSLLQEQFTANEIVEFETVQDDIANRRKILTDAIDTWTVKKDLLTAVLSDVSAKGEDNTSILDDGKLDAPSSDTATSIVRQPDEKKQSVSSDAINTGMSADNGAKGHTDGVTHGLVEQSKQRLAVVRRSVFSLENLRRDLDRLSVNIADRAMREQLQAGIDSRRAKLTALTRSIEQADAEEMSLLDQREELRSLKNKALSVIEPLKEKRDRLQADLERLGPEPEEGEPAETDEIKEERLRLESALAAEDALILQSDLNLAETDRLLAQITAARRDLFYRQILARGMTPFSPDVIQSAIRNLKGIAVKIEKDWRIWRANAAYSGGELRAYGIIGLSFLFGFLIFVPARRWIVRQVLNGLQQAEPTPGRRAWAAVLRIIARAVPGAIAGLIIFEALKSQGIIDATTRQLAQSLWGAMLGLLMIEAGTTAILSPSVPGWRLIPLEKASGQFVKYLMLGIVFVFFIDRVLTAGVGIFGGSQELALEQSAISAFLIGIATILICKKNVWLIVEQRRQEFSSELITLGRNIRTVMFGIGIFIVISVSFGYVALGHFIATRVVIIGGLVIVGLFIRLITREALRSLDSSFTETKKKVKDESDGERLLFFWIGAFIDLLIILALLPPMAIAVGFEWVDVRDVITNAFFGFKVGSVSISLAKLLSAATLLIVILGVTRFIQRTGEKTFFPRTRLDVGVQNSLKTLIGYVGLIIAVISSISVLGFNLSNLAIIAGALSVGIGFGLQSIVNNFVSGLILLFERPIKVGDWIVVASGEGTVKRISVRSTEIETWDRSSIIVPNSELISSSVTNWTLKDRMTRVTIPIGVSYDSDPKKVIAIFEKVISENFRVLSFPEPFVFFAGFGDSSLDFELRVYVSQTAERLPVQNEIRIAAFQALTDEGIEIPFPQRDLHLRSTPQRLSDENASDIYEKANVSEDQIAAASLAKDKSNAAE
ncbi:MAG: DUF3772 domain-containing protein [Pseudomonadota bacterium]